MPNQRDPNKELLGGYIDKKLKREVEAIATEEKVDRTEVIERIVDAAVRQYKKTKKLPKRGLTVFNTLCNCLST